MKHIILIIICNFFICHIINCQTLRDTSSNIKKEGIPIPSGPQLRWQNYERIMFIHFAPNTWTGLSQDDNSLPLARINPTKLNTDQWCKAAKSWGAKMILFVAKHTGGFCLWQTNTTDYGVRNTPWKNGKGDVLAELSKSCDKYGLDLGVYIYAGDKTWGAGIGSGGRTKDPAKQEAYNNIFRQQLTEVLSKYKPMKEVWFDGSCVIDVSDILQKYASDAVIFQGPHSTIRWVGNEKGIAPYPNWYMLNNFDLKTGVSTALQSNPDGDAYAPVECDVPLLMTKKTYKWFWTSNTENMILSVPDLMDIYYKSVGRGSVLLLNSTPDTTGLIPTSHVKRYQEFGKELKRRFDKPLVSGSGKGNVVEISLKKLTTVNCVVIQEDISLGQRVMKFEIEGFSNGQWFKLKDGSSVGSKRIEQFPAVELSKIRLHVTEAIAPPVIKNLTLFNIKQSEQSVNESSKNVEVTLREWHNQTFSKDWQDFSLDLTPYLLKVGQFELRFQEKLKQHGLEFKDWKVELNGAEVLNAIRKTGDGTFIINNSQDFNKDKAAMILTVQIRTKEKQTTGNIKLRML